MNLNENSEVLVREMELTKLHDRIQWLEKGLKLVIKIANDKESGIVMAAQAVLDGEPTTADEYNDEEDVQLGASIVKSNDEVSGVFMSDGKIEQIDYESSPDNTGVIKLDDEYNISEGRRGQGYDYGEFEDENDFDVSPDAPVVRLGTLIPKNTVYMSDINKEIAKEWKK